jgi:purine-nucleoside phosphorylase
MMPEVSLSGDGFCRYLQPVLPTQDCFLERTAPDAELAQALARAAAPLAQAAGVPIHTGPVFCIDSILAQFGRLEYLSTELGCAGIEMETAAVFKAARLVGIRAAALLSVSDVPIRGQTLYAGRSAAERERRQETRRKILAKALLDCLDSCETGA